MKKFIVALTLSTLSFSSFAASGDSVSLLLKGTVAPILEISIVAKARATTLDLSQAVTAESVATLTEVSNVHTGYKIFARSEKEGKLTHTVETNSHVNYTLTYGDNDSVPLGLNFAQINGSNNTLKGTRTKDIKISYGAPTNLSAGIYQDTVHFQIVAN